KDIENHPQVLWSQGAILYASCIDANAGIFETILTDQDVVNSNALNHASIINGARLCGGCDMA
ncbi:hypothetical protein BGX34_004117, partial [Mortierella sp. NVP85]